MALRETQLCSNDSFTARLVHYSPGLRRSEPCRWRPVASPVMRLIGSSGANSPEMREELLWDVLSSDEQTEATRRSPPLWLRHVREQIAEAPHEAAIATLAAEAGVHRVHLSRQFRGAYGLPPSLYRLRCMAARALQQVNRGMPLAEAAASAGFADQSHMCRAFRKQIHMPIGQVKKLLA